jgi:hypothetical protein
MKLLFAIAAITCIVAGCGASETIGSGSSTPSATPIPTASVFVDSTGLTTPVPTPNIVTEAPTARPTAAPTPTPDAVVNKVLEVVRACQSSSYTRAMVIEEVQNTGNGWAQLGGGDYTVFDNDENVVGTGNFTYAYPKYLAPGARGYLADDGIFEDTKVSTVKRVEADGTFTQVAQSDVVQLKTAKVTIKRESYGNGLHTTGTITNSSSVDVTDAHVGSFFLDGNHKPIGYAWTNLIENLTAGKTKGFATTDSWCGISQASVKSVVTLAGDDNF